MANTKIKHDDSNTTRAAIKQEQEKLLQDAFTSVNFDDTAGYRIYNQDIYNKLVNAIKGMNVTHLTDIDLFGVVEVANTMHLIQQMDNEITRHGITQKLLTREGSTKLTVLPHISQRNALLNTLDKQLSSLMLSPAQRHQLITSVQSDLSSINFSEDELAGILDGLQ
ncbi:P27 family phage terminase small subunit [Rummeliibacillus stabekisii]|uniref:P27 family phage terminase small subunit n=1 Tax=Rummeliibacillus stabekisii TaxID=241244 RepID=UPI003711D3EB